MSSSGDLRFPLEERYLARVRIARNRFEDWKLVAQRELAAVLENNNSWYYRPNDFKTSYRPMYEQDAIRGFMRPVDQTNKKDWLALAHLQMTLDDAIDGLYATSTADLRAASAQLLGESFLDAAVLHSHERRSQTDPFRYVGFKWLAMSTPGQAIIKPRDYVFFEHSGTTHDTSGRRVLYIYQRTFPLQVDELREASNGCVRGSYNQFTLMRMENGALLYQSIGQLDPADEVPAWVATRYMTEQFESIKKLVLVASARAIFACGVLKRLPPTKTNGENKACVGCEKKFGMMRARIGCRGCSHSVCKHCVTTLTFFNEEAQYHSHTARVLNEGFCKNCIKHAADNRGVETLSATLVKTSLRGEFTSTTSSTSSLNESSARVNLNSTEDTRRIHTARRTDSGADDGFRSPASSRSSTTTTPHARPPLSTSQNAAFEQMQASIRQQEELLYVIQQERAKMQARQQFQQSSATPVRVPVSDSLKSDDDSSDRFELLV